VFRARESLPTWPSLVVVMSPAATVVGRVN